MKKLVMFLIPVLALLARPAAAATCSGGQSCWNKDPATTTRNGTLCSSGAFTVSGAFTKAGTNGSIYVELRWSSWCTANWSRGTIMASNSLTKQIGVKASPSNSGYYSTRYSYGAGTLPVGTQLYSWMVDGSSLVTASAGINATVCNGNRDASGNYTGFPCSYNPLASYSG